MRAIVIGLGATLVLGLCGVVAFSQGGAGRAPDPPAPKDKAAAWAMTELKAVGQELGDTKTTTHRFFGEKGYNFEVRRLVGAQPILQHGKKSDFMVIQDGEGTFMSGGELVDGKAGGEDQGDLRGASIRGGVSRILKPGDIMFVPAGVPHGFVETKDHVTFAMVRFDTK